MANQRKTLGRGLGAIIGAGVKKVSAGGTPAAHIPARSESVQTRAAGRNFVGGTIAASQVSSNGLFSEILLAKVVSSPYQARTEFDEGEIKSLADSISSEGLLQPVLVRRLKDGNYELLAGERRVRACRLLGLKKIIACVQDASDASAAAKGLIENIHRMNLNPVEEARGISNMMENFRLTQDEISKRLGRPRSSIANSLRLLKLPKEVQGYISSGLISAGHAKVILGFDDPSRQLLLARKIIESGLNVRGAEESLRRIRHSSSPSAARSAQEAVVSDIRKKISERLNAEVELKHSNKGGKIIVRYLGNDYLKRILDLIGVKI